MLMAAKPTPSVMPTKYFPSRVNLSLRGGRAATQSRRCQRVRSRARAGGGGSVIGGVAVPLGARRAEDGAPGFASCTACAASGDLGCHARPSLAQSGTGTRATMSRTAPSASSRDGT